MMNKSMLKKIIIVAFLLIFSIGYVRQIVTINRIEKEISNKESELAEIKSQNSRLQDEVNKINEGSTEYLEKLARERLGMIKPGEKIVNTKTVEKSNDKDQHNKSN